MWTKDKIVCYTDITEISSRYDIITLFLNSRFLLVEQELLILLEQLMSPQFVFFFFKSMAKGKQL
jgi:hypothetical protein